MNVNTLEKLLCRDDEGCRESIRQLRELIRSLDEAAYSIKDQLTLESTEAPLIYNIANIREIYGKLREEVESDEIALYLVRRALYLKASPMLERREGWLKCPVCGQPPTLIYFKPSDEGLYSGDIAYARCICGMEWKYREWVCPSCGIEGRESFRVMISRSTGLEVRTCRNCGHSMIVATRINDDKHYFHAVANLVLEAIRDEQA